MPCPPCQCPQPNANCRRFGVPMTEGHWKRCRDSAAHREGADRIFQGVAFEDRRPLGLKTVMPAPAKSTAPADLEPAGLDTFRFVAPLGNHEPHRWQGIIPHPWNYRIAVGIPHLETLAPLKMILELYRRQTVRPYLMVVDTGSTPACRRQLESLRAEDLEIHFLAANAYRNSSEPVALANDVIQSRCPTDYLLFTHADVFPERRDLLEMLLSRCTPTHPVVAYRMTRRDAEALRQDAETAGLDLGRHVLETSAAVISNQSARWMAGHTILAVHVPTIDKTGATWTMRRGQAYGLPWNGSLGWPDTESAWNMAIKAAGIEPAFIGEERNFQATRDANITHVRNYTGSKIYGSSIFATAQATLDETMGRAARHLLEWPLSPS